MRLMTLYGCDVYRADGDGPVLCAGTFRFDYAADSWGGVFHVAGGRFAPLYAGTTYFARGTDRGDRIAFCVAVTNNQGDGAARFDGVGELSELSA